MSLEEFIIELEGFENKVYKDSAGLDTIGVGHLIKESEKKKGIYLNGKYIDPYKGLTNQQVLDLLSQDLGAYKAVVSDNVKVKLVDHQWKALVSFCFNVGIGAFQNSTLLKKINEKKWKDITQEFARWKFSGGKLDSGLINRREKEIKMWLGINSYKE